MGRLIREVDKLCPLIAWTSENSVCPLRCCDTQCPTCKVFSKQETLGRGSRSKRLIGEILLRLKERDGVAGEDQSQQKNYQGWVAQS